METKALKDNGIYSHFREKNLYAQCKINPSQMNYDSLIRENDITGNCMKIESN